MTYSPTRRHIKKMKNTSAFDPWSSSGAVLFCQPHQQLFTHSFEVRKLSEIFIYSPIFCPISKIRFECLVKYKYLLTIRFSARFLKSGLNAW